MIRKHIIYCTQCFLTAVTDNQDIIFYYLKGNHDAESMFIGMNKIPDNLKLFGTEWTEYKITSEKIITK